MARFCVIGSLNMDLVARVDRFPEPGETRAGRSFGTFPGGKGANQAVALARLGADVRMVGKLGDDIFGADYRRTLRAEGVDDDTVETGADEATGIAMIEIDDTGENHIVIVAGANGRVDEAFIDRALEKGPAPDFVLFQLEIPFTSILHGLRRARELGSTTILDPAPAHHIPEEAFGLIDFLTPNESETRVLLGRGDEAGSHDRVVRSHDHIVGSHDRIAQEFHERGTRTVVFKLGDEGAFAATEHESYSVPGFPVEPVDTTAAGDAFNAGLAYALGQGQQLSDAVRFANAVGACACTAVGAQSAMPSLERVQEMLGG